MRGRAQQLRGIFRRHMARHRPFLAKQGSLKWVTHFHHVVLARTLPPHSLVGVRVFRCDMQRPEMSWGWVQFSRWGTGVTTV